MISRFLDMFTPREKDDGVVDADRVRVATCVLLLEVAHAEDGLSDDEFERIREVLVRRFDLSQTEAHDLMEAAEEARRDSHDLWRFTNRINQGCTPQEKRAVMREVWRVIYADGELGGHEDHLVHRMGTLLNLTHPQLIEEKMAVLKEMRGQAE